MADCFDDAEFWLPPEFLTDEDFLLDRTSFTVPLPGGGRLGSGSGSGLSSPIDSLLGSLEAESDEEDLFADLTRKMANNTLEDGFMAAAAANSKVTSQVRLPSGSPQSTLCPGWDLLYEAAGEVARLRLGEQLYGINGGDAMYGPLARPATVLAPVKAHSSNGGFNCSLLQHPQQSYQQLVANQIQQLKQQQAMIKQQRQPVATWGLNAKPNTCPYHALQTGGRKLHPAIGGGTGRPLPAPAASAWPSLQNQNGSGMRDVFLGAPPTGKRECAGTGVFLPRRAGSHPEPRKKPAAACSSVLVPEKVVRALKLNLENVGSQTHLQYRLNRTFSSENDCVWNQRRTTAMAQQNRTGHPQPLDHEIRLPQEWTY